MLINRITRAHLIVVLSNRIARAKINICFKIYAKDDATKIYFDIQIYRSVVVLILDMNLKELRTSYFDVFLASWVHLIPHRSRHLSSSRGRHILVKSTPALYLTPMRLASRKYCLFPPCLCGFGHTWTNACNTMGKNDLSFNKMG